MSLLALSIERPMAGYNYPVPDNPLVLPKRTTTTSTTTTSKPEEGVSSRLPLPEDSLILPTKNTATTTKKQPSPAKNTATTEQEVTSTEPVQCKADDASCQGYEYPTPENPLVLPSKKVEEPLETYQPQKPVKPVIQPELEPEPEFAIEPETKAEEEPTTLPKCGSDGFELDIRQPEIPGVTCLEDNETLETYQPQNPAKPVTQPEITINQPEAQNTLPKCGSDGFDLDIRQVEIPGITCLEAEESLPPCQSDLEQTSLDIPGITCLQQEKEAGYQYPVPDNPLELPEKLLEESARTKEHDPLMLNDRALQTLDEDFIIDSNELPDFNAEEFSQLFQEAIPFTTPSSKSKGEIETFALSFELPFYSSLFLDQGKPSCVGDCAESENLLQQELAILQPSTVEEAEEAEKKKEPLLGLDFNLASQLPTSLDTSIFSA